MTRTTPPRPVDFVTVFPELAPLARTAIRLHPRPGRPSMHDSSVGGPLLWPATEPWPYCHTDDHHVAMSPESDGPIAMVPVAQLYVRDVPGLPLPEGSDLLQVLWCPFEHDNDGLPKTVLFWRSAATVTDVLVEPPQPADFAPDLAPEPCLINPEQVIEYPRSAELERELGSRVAQWTMPQIPGVEFDVEEVDVPYDFLCTAPGWKIGGFVRWGMQDPYPNPCPTCGTPTEPLLTIASEEWDSFDKDYWVPFEDQAANIAWGDIQGGPSGPTRICVSDVNDQIIRVCPTSHEHPHIQMMQ
ncbi:hypothetical protein [Nocardia alni]|uniref:hypothetical protein n=1 Tax=Nocardia alni TaxID=2815723 RepID=UPI001C24C92C|nr:hypothetical protein [Nocardia alni]